jgi:hypothetical protein
MKRWEATPSSHPFINGIFLWGEKKPMAKWIGHIETRCIEK